MKVDGQSKSGDSDHDHHYEQLVWNSDDPTVTPPSSSRNIRPRGEPRSGVRGFWHKFDALYMKPYFGGSQGRDHNHRGTPNSQVCQA
jgi:hypothetical protein